MEFFKDLESVNSVKMSGLKAGKAAEQAEFDNLLREVEKDLDQAAAQAPRRRSEDEVRDAIVRMEMLILTLLSFLPFLLLPYFDPSFLTLSLTLSFILVILSYPHSRTFSPTFIDSDCDFNFINFFNLSLFFLSVGACSI